MANSKTYRSLTGKRKQTQWGPGWSRQNPPHLSACPALADYCCGKAAPVLSYLLIHPEQWEIWIFLNVNKYVKLRKIPNLHSLKRWCVCMTNLACEFAPSAVHQIRGLGIETTEKHRKGMIIFEFLKAELNMYCGSSMTKATLFIVLVTNDM